MKEGAGQPASALRERFKAIPEGGRAANQAFSVRIWRGLSWLERSEAAQDPEGRFISLWIAFNAIYGHLDDDGRNAQDHASWQSFLARMVEHDREDRLGMIICDEQTAVLRLIDNEYIFRPFWLGQDNWKDKLGKSVRYVLRCYQNNGVVGVLQELFERLYILRSQVFHGAATSGSKLNRRQISAGTGILSALVPAMIAIMIDAGPEADWGEICFPPMKENP